MTERKSTAHKPEARAKAFAGVSGLCCGIAHARLANSSRFTWDGERPEQLRRVQRRQAGEVFDLPATGEAGSDDHGFLVGLSQGRKEPLFADCARKLVMLALVTERSSHSTAT